MRSLVAEREAQTVHTAADAVSAQLHHRSQALRAVTALAENAASPQEALREFGFLQADFPGGLAILAANGEVLAASGPREWVGLPLADLLRKSRTSGRPEFSQTLEMAGVTGRVALVGFAGEGRGAAGAFLPGDLVAQVLDDAFPPTSQANAWLIDVDGNILYRRSPVPSQADSIHLAGLDQALRGETGVTFAEHAGEEYVVAYTPIPATGWALLLEEPWEAVDNPLLRQTQAAPLALIPALLLALLTLGFAIRSIVQPLRALERRAAAVGAEDLRALEKPVGGIAEIKSLQHTLVQMERRLRTYQDSLRRYAGAVVRSMEDERRRVARDLHDDTIQELIALNQQTQLAQMAVRDHPAEAGRHLAELRLQSEALLRGVRRVIRALRPIYLEDLGLPAALEMLAEDAGEAAGIPVAYRSRGAPRRLLPEQEIAIYRIAQEALTNVARHAQARSATLEVRFEPDRFTLSVNDDGIGMPPPARLDHLDSPGHYGLMGMQERAELIHARLALTSRPGQGTTVHLELPL